MLFTSAATSQTVKVLLVSSLTYRVATFQSFTNPLTFPRLFQVFLTAALLFIKSSEVYRQAYVYSWVNIVAILAVHLVHVNFTYQYSGYVCQHCDYCNCGSTSQANHNFLIFLTFPWPMSNFLTFPGFQVSQEGDHPELKSASKWPNKAYDKESIKVLCWPALVLSNFQPVRDVNVNTNGNRTDNIFMSRWVSGCSHARTHATK